MRLDQRLPLLEQADVAADLARGRVVAGDEGDALGPSGDANRVLEAAGRRVAGGQGVAGPPSQGLWQARLPRL